MSRCCTRSSAYWKREPLPPSTKFTVTVLVSGDEGPPTSMTTTTTVTVFVETGIFELNVSVTSALPRSGFLEPDPYIITVAELTDLGVVLATVSGSGGNGSFS